MESGIARLNVSNAVPTDLWRHHVQRSRIKVARIGAGDRRTRKGLGGSGRTWMDLDGRPTARMQQGNTEDEGKDDYRRGGQHLPRPYALAVAPCLFRNGQGVVRLLKALNPDLDASLEVGRGQPLQFLEPLLQLRHALPPGFAAAAAVRGLG